MREVFKRKIKMQGAKQGIIIVVIMIEKPNRPGKDTVEDSVNRF